MQIPKQILPLIPLFFLVATASGSVDGLKSKVLFNVGVLLDTGLHAGLVGNVSISIAMEDFYAQHTDYTTKLVLHIVDTSNSTIGAVSAALDLLENKKVQAIIGPQGSDQAVFISDLGSASQVPIISFSATSPTLTSSHPPYFIRAACSDSSQVNAIASLVKAFSWRQVVPIYEDTGFGTGMIPYLIDALQGAKVLVPHRSILSPAATDDRIQEELYKLMTMQTRVFIVHMSPSLGSRLLQKANEIGMISKGYVWIMTDGITNALDSLDSLTIKSMQGLLGVKHYVHPSIAYEDFRSRWKRRFRLQYPNATEDLNIYGLWAYDAIWALAMAVEKIKVNLDSQLQSPVEASSSINLETLPVSMIGPKLRDAILKTRFNGMAGEFFLIDNQLQSSTFEIINVNGKGGREIGLWSPSYGISRTLPPVGRDTYSISTQDLSVVIWPGEPKSLPMGWQTPTNDKILRIAVPVKIGFDEFIKVEHDKVTNATKVTGYCKDVFEAVVRELPYALSYEFIPFENSNGDMAGSYNDLVEAVNQQRFDAVVGDTTITANRSQFADFTLPYTESGVAMIVPLQKDPNKNIWIFLKPLTVDLWLATFGFCLYTGFVIWVIEHKTNLEFKGTWLEELGVISYFIFSMIVFSHRENVKSNFSRIVVIVWIFVVLVLTSSYTASLTSILTVVKLKPTITDVQQLVKNGNMIGYHKGSFLQELLQKTFDKSKMIAVDNPEVYIEALNNGSIAVVFHEIPYLKVFLSRYCSGYAMSDPTHKTAGFGFAFPKGSPLVPDISRAILKVTKGDQFMKLDKKWFGSSCIIQDSTTDPQSLTFLSFWGLFLITGGISILSVLSSVALFLRKEWDQLRSMARVEPTKSEKFHAWLKHYGAFKEGAPKTNEMTMFESSTHDGSQSPMSTSNFSFTTSSPVHEITISEELENSQGGASGATTNP